MASFEDVVQAFIRMEGSDLANSINQTMVRNFGKWDVGHLVYAGQAGATPIWINDRNWAGWNSREESVEGLRRDLKAKANKGMTLAQAIAVYAPASENQTQTYITNVSQWSGWPPDTPLSTIVAGGSPDPMSPPAQPTQAPGDNRGNRATVDKVEQVAKVVASSIHSIWEILKARP